MQIVNIAPSALKPYNKNAKKHPSDQVDAVAESIKQFGFVQPVVIDKDNIIVIGHCRVMAAKRLKMDEVPCVLVDDLTPEQVNALRLADNKTNESAWDIGLLNDSMVDVGDIDMTVFGFDLGEEQAAVEDDYEPELPEEPKSFVGQVYQLGRHRLMCGDSTSVDDVSKLMNGAQADLLLTDPPYNVDYEGTAGKIKGDKQSDENFRQFLVDAFTSARVSMKPGASFYIFHADSEGFNFRGACKDATLRVRQCLIWIKNSLVLGRQDYQWQHEPCLAGDIDGDTAEPDPVLYGWKDGAAHFWNGGRKQTTLLYCDRPKKSAEHPTMKPIVLFDRLMKNSSTTDSVVLDLFGGSGTSIMAAEQNGRTCYMMEFDPRYIDVIIDRWQKFTGETAVLVDG